MQVLSRAAGGLRKKGASVLKGDTGTEIGLTWVKKALGCGHGNIRPLPPPYLKGGRGGLLALAARTEKIIV
jgi:hypothetical protein